MAAEYEVRSYKDAVEFRGWLDAHYADTDGIWMRIYKKASGAPTVTYAEALDIALCYGWIDGQKKTFDEQSFLQKFTPRRPRSLWSKRNIEYVARLTEAGLMMSSGIAEVERAKADGRWAAAYDKPSEMVIPAEFMTELQKHPKALAIFETLNKSNKYAIAWRLQTAKTEVTRLRRQDRVIATLEAGERLV